MNTRPPCYGCEQRDLIIKNMATATNDIVDAIISAFNSESLDQARDFLGPFVNRIKLENPQEATELPGYQFLAEQRAFVDNAYPATQVRLNGGLPCCSTAHALRLSVDQREYMARRIAAALNAVVGLTVCHIETTVQKP